MLIRSVLHLSHPESLINSPHKKDKPSKMLKLGSLCSEAPSLAERCTSHWAFPLFPGRTKIHTYPGPTAPPQPIQSKMLTVGLLDGEAGL